MHRRVCGLRLGISERCRRIGNATQHSHGIVHARRRPNNQIVATHGVGQRREQCFGVGHDRAIVSVVAVHEPRRELELCVQASTRAQQAVWGSAACGDVGVQDIAGRGGCRSQPLQVYCRIADRDGVPIGDADHGGNPALIGEEEAGG